MYQGKREIRTSHRSNLSAQARSFPERLSPHLLHAFEAASESGASSWLTTFPGFAMPKGEFCDALCLRFGWQLPNLVCVANH